MKKQLLGVLFGALMLVGTTLPVSATTTGEIITCEGGKTRSTYSVGEPIWEDNITSRAATITVYVTSPCDQSFRSRYNDYAYQANRVVERTDDYLSQKFGIDFQSVAQPNWTSSGSSAGDVLDSAKNSCGLTYNGNKQADIMMAFTGTKFNTTTGIAYLGLPYACMFDSGYDQNAKSCQHEFGHTYGLGHHTGTDSCVMKQGGPEYIDNLCSTHLNEWNNAKNKY